MSCSKSGCKCGEVAIAATQPRPSCSLGAVSCSQIYTRKYLGHVGGDSEGIVRRFLHNVAAVMHLHVHSN